MFNFERIVHKMSLIHDLTEFCDQEYKPHCQNDPCLDCTHPSGKCSGSCLECSKQINYHTEGGRSLSISHTANAHWGKDNAAVF